MKLWRNLIIMIAVVAVLIAAFFVVKNLQTDQPKDNTSTQKDIDVINEDFDKIESITLKSDQGVLVYKTTKESGVWSLETSETTAFDLDNDQISSNGEILRKIQADSLVEKGSKNLKKYGLDHPRCTMTLLRHDGTKKVITIGDTSTTTGKTFAFDEENVYTIYDYAVTAMTATIKDLEVTQTYQIPKEDITAMKIERKGKATIDIALREDNKNVYETHTSKLTMRSPYEGCDVNDENMQSMVYNYLNQIAFTKETEFNSTDYAAYGVTDPAYKFTITYYDSSTGKNVNKVLSVSDLKDGKYYAKFDDYAKMYCFPKDSFAFADNIDPYRAVSQVGFIYNIDVVDKIVIDTNGDTYTFDITHKKVSDTETEAHFKFNGKKVNDSAALSMYQHLIGFYREGVYTGKGEPTQSAVFHMTFTLSNHQTKTLEFKPINDREYSYTVDGHTQFIIKKNTVQTVMDMLKSYQKDPSKAPAEN